MNSSLCTHIGPQPDLLEAQSAAKALERHVERDCRRKPNRTSVNISPIGVALTNGVEKAVNAIHARRP